MTQYTGVTTIPASFDGATWLTDYGDFINHVLSQGSGASRPTKLAEGGLWSRDEGSSVYTSVLYDGTHDHPLLKASLGSIYAATVGGTANARTVTSGLSLPALVQGMRLIAEFPATNTGAMTLNVDGLGVKTVKTVPDQSGTNQALPSGYIRDDVPTELFYDGTYWIASRAVEGGTNANGTWTAWEDGTLICRSGQINGGDTWTYPVGFTVAPDLSGMAVTTASSMRVLTYANRGATTVDINGWNAAGNASTPPCLVIAVGTWL